MKCLPFMHKYKTIRWRLVHIPESDPSTILLRLKCKKCGKEKDYFTFNIDRNWEKDNKELEGFWFSKERG